MVAALAGCSTRQAQEQTLKHDLLIMRTAIDKYALEKKRAPQSLRDLVDSHYLSDIPIDPFTGKKDWIPDFTDTVLSVDQTTTGMGDVHSSSAQIGSNGTPYNTW
jgi:general secretion pathway protein G